MHNLNQNYNTTEYTVIYVYSIPGLDSHRNDLKIGKTNIKLPEYEIALDKQQAIEKAAHTRILSDLKTPDINYDLEYACLAIKDDQNTQFMDHEVHEVLKRSGFENVVHTHNKKRGEWFKINLETAINAINAVKAGRASLDPNDIVSHSVAISFRKGSQTDAINKTIDAIKKGKTHFLWDAKMRFGKTLTALEVAKRMNYGKVLIITHRPEVSDDWFKDFNTLFRHTDYKFGSLGKGENISNLQNQYLKAANGQQANPFVYFASIQYLRHEVKSPEKKAILTENWDMLIIDEADEGVKTTLSNDTIMPIHREFTLMLSGTPFNLLEDYKEDEIYSWDYTKEQELKAHWEDLYPDEPNPYYKLPKLSIFVYDLNKYIPDTQYKELTDKAFNFKEFFKADTDGEFVHEKDVLRFLDLITTEGVNNFPFSTKEYRQNLRHTLWMVPGVKEARALEKLLNKHPVFTHFNIANVAGDGNEEIAEKKSRNIVKKAITDDPLNAYSVTISCGKMTRGVSVPEWTAVFMLSNTSSASTYLQTIFRGQTPWEYRGLLKTECFVFDFAPDRTLTVVAEVMNIKKKRPTTEEVKSATGKFLNYCSVISATHGEMKPFSAQKLLHAIKKVAIQKVTRNGFDDTRLYNIENLDRCSDEDLQDFATLNAIVGKSKGDKENNKIKMADNGFTEEEREKAEKAKQKKKEKQPLTPEEEELLRRKREIADQRKTRMSILRGVSIRMPMLIFGCKIDKNGNEIKADDEITLNQFIENVDDESWKEFMPDGVTKKMLSEKFAKYYDDEVFIGAGIDIRLRALAADLLPPSERVVEIAEIFKGFKNPDKETVLTPWHVANTHLSSTLGGSNFNDMIEFDQDSAQSVTKLGLPNWVEQGDVSRIWNERASRVLEINSKSGLYPLLCAYNFYTQALSSVLGERTSEDEVFRKLWNAILANNIYVVCKSPMAKTIAERTLAGYTDARTNIMYVKDFVDKLRAKKPYESYNVTKELLNKFNLGEDVKFDAVVGNPPYQESTGQTETQTQGNSTWIYYHFQNAADKIGTYTSLIYPFGGWFDSPKAFQGFGKKLLSDGHTLRIDAYEGTTDKRAWYRTDKEPQPVFGGSANLSAGISIVLRDNANFHNEYVYSNRIYSDNSRTVNISDWESLTPSPDFTMGDKLTGPKLHTRIIKGIFALESNFVELNPDKVSQRADDWKDPIQILTNDRSGSAGRAKWFWTDKSTITKGRELIDEYKVVTTSAYPKKTFVSGNPTVANVHKRLGELVEIMPKGSAFGRSKLCLFHSEDKLECENFLKYTQTNFFARLVLDEPNRTSSIGYVIPDQDFTVDSDIDWTKSTPEIDQQLYRKYNLNQEEIDFIESRVKPMA